MGRLVNLLNAFYSKRTYAFYHDIPHYALKTIHLFIQHCGNTVKVN